MRENSIKLTNNWTVSYSKGAFSREFEIERKVEPPNVSFSIEFDKIEKKTVSYHFFKDNTFTGTIRIESLPNKVDEFLEDLLSIKRGKIDYKRWWINEINSRDKGD